MSFNIYKSCLHCTCIQFACMMTTLFEMIFYTCSLLIYLSIMFPRVSLTLAYNMWYWSTEFNFTHRRKDILSPRLPWNNWSTTSYPDYINKYIWKICQVPLNHLLFKHLNFQQSQGNWLGVILDIICFSIYDAYSWSLLINLLKSDWRQNYKRNTDFFLINQYFALIKSRTFFNRYFKD